MTTIWQTVAGRGDPVDGEPAQFRIIENDFRRIKDRMFDLDDDFDAIRSGTSGDFRGEAADAFREKLNLIATAVGEVPLVAAQLQQTFRHHRVELERLQKRVDAAVARAQTNWDEKRNADADHDQSTQRLSFVDQQIDWLESQGDAVDDGDKAYWTSERIEALNWVSSTRTRVHRADDRLEDSREDWRNLHEEEEELDEATAAALRGTVLWSLADPSFLEQIAEAVDAFASFVASGGLNDLLLEVCRAVREVCSYLSAALAVVSLVLMLTGVGAPLGLLLAGLAIAATQMVAGAILWGNGELSSLDFALDVVGVVTAGLTFNSMAAAKLVPISQLSKWSGAAQTVLKHGFVREPIAAAGDVANVIGYLAGRDHDTVDDRPTINGDAVSPCLRRATEMPLITAVDTFRSVSPARRFRMHLLPLRWEVAQ